MIYFLPERIYQYLKENNITDALDKLTDISNKFNTFGTFKEYIQFFSTRKQLYLSYNTVDIHLLIDEHSSLQHKHHPEFQQIFDTNKPLKRLLLACKRKPVHNQQWHVDTVSPNLPFAHLT